MLTTKTIFAIFPLLLSSASRPSVPGLSLGPSLAHNWTTLGSLLPIVCISLGDQTPIIRLRPVLIERLRRADRSSNSTAIPCGETTPVIPWTRCCPC
ncbi:hypothetical protein EDD17DRAFT_1667199 [Pisolithus thermaeus]|nr:hypothetical protein EDD17DRAFT_1667199 [Pisolithus thermaeus]